VKRAAAYGGPKPNLSPKTLWNPTMDITPVKANDVFDAPGYAQAYRVDAFSSLIFMSGQVALDDQGEAAHPGDFAAQAHQVMNQIKSLVEAGGSSISRVIKLTCYVTDVAHRPLLAQARREVFGDKVPPLTVVAVKALMDPEWLLEAEAIAAI
jgi:2-iminobutanoate/2-iminopropanoate deaminase